MKLSVGKMHEPTPLAINDTAPSPLFKFSGSIGAAAASFIALSIALGLGGGQLAKLSGGAPKLDFLWMAGPDAYRDALTRYGEAGRHLFFWLNALDMLFPLATAWFGVLLLRRTFNSAPWLCGLPVAFAGLDILENTLFFVVLAAWPQFSPDWAAACAVVTAVKIAVLGATYIAMSAALLVQAWQRVRKTAIRRF